MKILISDYTFDASAQIVTIDQFSPINLEQVRLITNVTDGIIIFNFADPSKGATLSGGNILTLAYDTTTMSDGDSLAIDYDDLTSGATIDGTVNIDGVGQTTDIKVTLDGEPVTGTFWQATQPVSVSSLPLPTGAATAANQTTGNSSLSTIAGAVSATKMQVNVTNSSIPVTDNSGSLTVDDGGSSLTVDGTIGISGSVAVTGPLTDTELRASDVDVNVTNASIPVTGTFWQATQPVSGTVTANAGTNLNTSLLALDSTVAKDSSLSTLNTSVNTLLKPASTLTAVTTVGTITNVVHVDDNSSTLSVDDGGGSITVDGSVTATVPGTVTVDSELTTADLDTGGGTDTRAVVGLVLAESGGGVLVGSANPIPISDNGSSLTIDGTVAIGAGSAVIGHVIADTGSTTAVTGNVTVVQGTGSNLHSVIDSGTITTITNVVHVDDNSSTLSIDDGAGSITVDGSVTVTQATGTNLHTVVDSGTISTITNVVHVDDNSSSITVDSPQLPSALGINTKANSLPIVTAADILTGSRSSNGSLIAATDISGYQFLSIQLTGTWVATVAWEFSNDNSNWWSPLLINAASSNASSASNFTSSSSSNGVWYTGSFGKYIRLTVSGYASGTVVATIALSTDSGTQHMILAGQSGTWNVGLNAGTNAIGKLSANSGVTIGAVEIAASQTLANVTTLGTITNVVHVDDNSGSLTVDAPVGTPVFTRLSDGSAALIGQKAMTASLPVVLASDQISIPVAATLTAETTKVIGTARTADGAGNLYTTNSTTYTAKFAQDTNLLGTLGTAFSTAGKVDIKGADGDVFVRQATASNLNATVVGTGTFATQVTPATSGGFTTFHLISANTTNATNIKASAGQVFGWYIYNAAATARKVAFHNTSGSPTAGASIFFTIMLPALSAANVMTETGIAFSSGIAITTVTDMTDAGTTVVSANDLNINIFYK